MAATRAPTASVRSALRAFVDRTTLFAFDLDGTLAPIVADPSRIAVPPAVRARLIRLDALAPVAVLTGRSRADAAAHLGFQPRSLVGNHGAEGLPGRERREAGYVLQSARWEEQLRALLPQARGAGIVVENKGATLSLHYRASGNRRGARMEILEACRRLRPAPRIVPGKCVENLLPRDAPGKGEALPRIMRALGCRRAVYVGDDETDEEVFRLAGGSVLGIRVGAADRSAARLRLRERREIGPLLDEILALLEPAPAPGRASR